MKATVLINDAYRACNRLFPGEILSGEDIDRGFDELGLVVDRLEADTQFLFKNVMTSAVQTGDITLGSGSWAAIAPGDNIVNVFESDVLLDFATPAVFTQYLETPQSGVPVVWTYDGFSVVSLYPSASGQTIKIETQQGVSQFADLETEYTLKKGYRSLLSVRLALRLHPIIAKLTALEIQNLEKEEIKCALLVGGFKPAMLDALAYKNGYNRPNQTFVNGY